MSNQMKHAIIDMETGEILHLLLLRISFLFALIQRNCRVVAIPVSLVTEYNGDVKIFPRSVTVILSFPTFAKFMLALIIRAI